MAGIDKTLTIYQGRRFKQIKRQDGRPVGVVMGMTEDLENNIWVEAKGPSGTLIRIQDQRVREAFSAPPAKLRLIRKGGSG